MPRGFAIIAAEVDRSQLLLHTVDVDRLIEEDHSARSIWQLVARLDLSLYHAEIAAGGYPVPSRKLPNLPHEW